MPHRILVVDDDVIVRDMMEQFLHGQLGFDVSTAESGEQALELALQQAYDLAILDVNLEGLSGTETYTRLRSLLPEIEALFFTGVENFEKSNDFLRFSLPPDRVIAKPAEDLAMLTRLIIGILGPPRA